MNAYVEGTLVQDDVFSCKVSFSGITKVLTIDRDNLLFSENPQIKQLIKKEEVVNVDPIPTEKAITIGKLEFHRLSSKPNKNLLPIYDADFIDLALKYKVYYSGSSNKYIASRIYLGEDEQALGMFDDSRKAAECCSRDLNFLTDLIEFANESKSNSMTKSPFNGF
jgi:hypothetical protein